MCGKVFQAPLLLPVTHPAPPTPRSNAWWRTRPDRFARFRSPQSMMSPDHWQAHGNPTKKMAFQASLRSHLDHKCPCPIVRTIHTSLGCGLEPLIAETSEKQLQLNSDVKSFGAPPNNPAFRQGYGPQARN